MIPCAYIFDIDGTLADCSHRLHYLSPDFDILSKKELSKDTVEKFMPDWERFYESCIDDKPIEGVIETLKLLSFTGIKILLVTGRPKKYLAQTLAWLLKQNIKFDGIYMREDGDYRQDYIVKHELYMNYISKSYAIQGVFEDRKQCVDMWRGLGLTCFQVANGEY